MFTTLREYYIDRNAKIIRAYLELRKKGITTREANEILSMQFTSNTEKVSKGTVNSIIFDAKYAYAAEAWEIIHKEEAEKEKLKQANGTTKAIAGEVATA